MAFFRIKKIKGKEYLYLVENEWKGKSSRQKVKGYIGRVHRPDIVNDVPFLQFKNAESVQFYMGANAKEKIIQDLIEWELCKFGINNDFSVDFENRKIRRKNKDVALFVNDGFLCGATIEKLLDFKAQGEEQDGYNLARAFVEAGIKIPQEVFVGLYQKLKSL